MKTSIFRAKWYLILARTFPAERWSFGRFGRISWRSSHSADCLIDSGVFIQVCFISKTSGKMYLLPSIVERQLAINRLVILMELLDDDLEHMLLLSKKRKKAHVMLEKRPLEGACTTFFQNYDRRKTLVCKF